MHVGPAKLIEGSPHHARRFLRSHLTRWRMAHDYRHAVRDVHESADRPTGDHSYAVGKATGLGMGIHHAVTFWLDTETGMSENHDLVRLIVAAIQHMPEAEFSDIRPE